MNTDILFNHEVNNMKKQILAGLLAATLSTAAVASEVTGYSPAVSGEPATAAAINEKFDALISAINDNNARIAELENASVSGKTYDFKEHSTVIGAHTYAGINHTPGPNTERLDGFARAEILTTTAQMTFLEDGTVNLDGRERRVEAFINASTDIGLTRDENFSVVPAWTQTGNIVTVTFPDGFAYEFTVSSGATMFTGMINNETDLEDTFTELVTVGETPEGELIEEERTVRLYQTESAFQIGVLIE